MQLTNNDIVKKKLAFVSTGYKLLDNDRIKG